MEWIAAAQSTTLIRFGMRQSAKIGPARVGRHHAEVVNLIWRAGRFYALAP